MSRWTFFHANGMEYLDGSTFEELETAYNSVNLSVIYPFRQLRIDPAQHALYTGRFLGSEEEIKKYETVEQYALRMTPA